MCSNKNFYSKCLINSFDEKCIKGVHIKVTKIIHSTVQYPPMSSAHTDFKKCDESIDLNNQKKKDISH